MFCLRSWLPLLFIPTNASPAFILLFFISTYFLNRPCVYCSILLVILFVSSCHWSDHCFFDLNGNWFEPRHLSSPFPNPISTSASAPASVPGMASANGSVSAPETAGQSVIADASILAAAALNDSARVLAEAAVAEVKRQMESQSEWTGLGLEWIRSLLGRREWRVPCLDVHIRL